MAHLGRADAFSKDPNFVMTKDDSSALTRADYAMKVECTSSPVTSRPDPSTVSPFMRAAVAAYHRAECDSIAQMADTLMVCPAKEWPGASKRVSRVDSGRVAAKLWRWSLKRWGFDFFPSIEYQIREANDALRKQSLPASTTV